MYQISPLNSCDYLKKISIQITVTTDKGNSRNEIDDIGVAVQSWLLVRVELTA